MAKSDRKSDRRDSSTGGLPATGQSTWSCANDRDALRTCQGDANESHCKHSRNGVNQRNSSNRNRRRRRELSPLFDEGPTPPPPPPRPLLQQLPQLSSSVSWSFSSSSSSSSKSLDRSNLRSKAYEPARYLSFIFDPSNPLNFEEKESIGQIFHSIKSYFHRFIDDPFCSSALWYLLQWLRTQNPLFLDERDSEKKHLEVVGSENDTSYVESSRGRRHLGVLASIFLEFALSFWEAKTYLAATSTSAISPGSANISSELYQQPIMSSVRRLRRWNTSCSRFLIWLEFFEPCIEMLARATPFLSHNRGDIEGKGLNYWRILNKIEQVKFIVRIARSASHCHLWKKYHQNGNFPYLLPTSCPHDDLAEIATHSFYENITYFNFPMQRHFLHTLTGFNTGIKMVLFADILHYIRPLIWIKARDLLETTKKQLGNDLNGTRRFCRPMLLKNFAVWVACFGIDVLSRYLSKRGLRRQLIEKFEAAKQQNGSLSKSTPSVSVPPEAFDELKRRRSKWWKYFLRNPVWETLTQPVTHLTVEKLLGNVPLVGSLLNNYIMSWILYQKCNHFMLERE